MNPIDEVKNRSACYSRQKIRTYLQRHRIDEVREECN